MVVTFVLEHVKLWWLTCFFFQYVISRTGTWLCYKFLRGKVHQVAFISWLHFKLSFLLFFSLLNKKEKKRLFKSSPCDSYEKWKCRPFARLWWDETMATVLTTPEPHFQVTSLSNISSMINLLVRHWVFLVESSVKLR